LISSLSPSPAIFFDLFLNALDFFIDALKNILIVSMANNLHRVAVSRKQAAVPVENRFRAIEQRINIPKGERMIIIDISFGNDIPCTLVSNAAIPMND